MASPRFDLDQYFKKDSVARLIAEKLMTGKALTRQELVEGTNTSVTSVNRVVDVLTEAGCTIRREIAEDGRQARFRLVEVNAPRRPWPSIDDEVRIVGGYLHGDQAMVEFESGKSRYRGTLAALARMPPLGTRGSVRMIGVSDDGLAELKVRTSGDPEPLQIEAVRATE